ncbi:hypothetical protein [Sideroxydans sp.]
MVEIAISHMEGSCGVIDILKEAGSPIFGCHHKPEQSGYPQAYIFLFVYKAEPKR